MKISKFFAATFLVWAAYDSHLFRRRRDRFASSHISFSLEAEAEAKAQREARKATRQWRDNIPPWYEPPPLKLKMKVNHFKSESKDPRYSDQRKIRRRINNM